MRKICLSVLAMALWMGASLGTASADSYTVYGSYVGLSNLDFGNPNPPPLSLTYSLPKFVSPTPGAILTDVNVTLHGLEVADVYLYNANYQRANDYTGQVAAILGVTMPNSSNLTVNPMVWNYPAATPYVLSPLGYQPFYSLTDEKANSANVDAAHIADFLGSGNYNFNIFGVDQSFFNFNTIGYAYALNFGDVALDVTYTYESAPVPEPGTIALLGLGMAGLAVYGKRRQNKA